MKLQIEHEKSLKLGFRPPQKHQQQHLIGICEMFAGEDVGLLLNEQCSGYCSREARSGCARFQNRKFPLKPFSLDPYSLHPAYSFLLFSQLKYLECGQKITYKKKTRNIDAKLHLRLPRQSRGRSFPPKLSLKSPKWLQPGLLCW